MKQIFVALATVLLTIPLAAQGQPQTQTQTQDQAQQPTFRTGVDVITVDVAAIDRNGQPVTDLHAPEFTVNIDGKEGRVVTADIVKYEYTPNAGVQRPPPRREESFETLYTTNITKPEGRMIMIAVDQMNIRPGAARPILDAASRFLDHLNPADRVAFVAYPEPGIVVDFTADRERVKLAMQKVIGTQSRFVEPPQHRSSSRRSTSPRRATSGASPRSSAANAAACSTWRSSNARAMSSTSPIRFCRRRGAMPTRRCAACVNGWRALPTPRAPRR